MALPTSGRAQYYKYLARLNFLCAEEADKKIGSLPGYELAAPPPVMTLCAHAIELSLKAFLLENGLSEKQVKNLGHDLVAAWEKAKTLRSDLPKINEGVLAIISDLLHSNRLRYGEESEIGKLPVYGSLSTLVRQMLELCGALSLADMVK